MRVLTLAVIALLHLTLVVTVWRAKPDSPINRFFALHTITIAGWTLGIALLQSGFWTEAGAKLTFASGSLIPATMLMFTTHFPAATHASWRPHLLIALGIGGFFTAASIATEWVVYDAQWNEITGVSRRPGVLYAWWTTYFLIALGTALGVLLRKWSSAKGRERIQLNYYGASLAFATAGATMTNIVIPATTGSSALSHLGPYFGLIMTTLTAHATLRNRFIDLRLVIHRCLTIAIAMTISFVPVLIFFVLIRRSLLLHFTLVEIAVIGAAFCAIALLIPITADVAERLIDRHIYRARDNPQRLLRQASSQLAHALDLAELLGVTANTVRAVGAPHGVAIYLDSDDSLRLSFIQKTSQDVIFSAPPEPVAVVVDAAMSRTAPLLRDELSVPPDGRLHEALEFSDWALVLPLLADQKVVGLIAVASKRSGDPYFAEEIDALATLANHAGTAIRNARLYAQVVVANEYVNRIVAAMPNAVVVFDDSGAVTLVNPAARDLLELAPKTLLKIDDLPPSLRTALEEVITNDRENVAHEITWTRSDAAPRSLLCTASQMPGHGRDRGVMVVFSDITPLKELDRQRTRAETLANLQRLTHTLAHEIGNPLVPIKTLTRLLPERAGDPGFVDKVSRIVSREIERIERLVARLRRVAPSAELTQSLVDVRTPMRHAVEVIEATAAEQQITLETVVPAHPVLVLGDSAELEELFLNLLTNALEAVADRSLSARSVRAVLRADAQHVIAEICDSGHGIPGDLMDRVFDPFVTTKARGSGLGLAICAGIVARHGGQLRAANADNGGAILTATLPAVEADRSPTASSSSVDHNTDDAS